MLKLEFQLRMSVIS